MTFQEFRREYPEVVSISCNFCGSGDSFDEFYNCDVFCEDENGKKISISEHLSEYEADHVFKDFKTVLFEIIAKDDRAYFNNEGCFGKIEVDLKTGRVKIHVTDYESDCVSVPEKMYFFHKSPESKLPVIENESCKAAYKTFIDEFPSIDTIKINFNGYDGNGCEDFFVQELVIQEENLTEKEKLFFDVKVKHHLPDRQREAKMTESSDSLAELVKEIINMDGRFDFTSEGSHGLIVIDCTCDAVVTSGHNYYREESPRSNNYWLITETQGIIEDAEEV